MDDELEGINSIQPDGPAQPTKPRGKIPDSAVKDE
jgi:hypothetical protein